MIGETLADIKYRKEKAQATKAQAEQDSQYERQALFELFKTKQWPAFRVSVYRRREAARAVMLSTGDEKTLFDARAAYRELTWILELEDNIPSGD